MLHVIWFQAVSPNSLKEFECLCGRDGMQFCTNPKQQKWPTLVHYLGSAVADGWRQTGSVQSPPSGGLTIPTLPCGLWCHTSLCLWMAMYSPLISNRWWETSKWWFFTKTSSQNKVKGTQKNSKRSHEKKQNKTNLYILNCCRLCWRQGYIVCCSALLRILKFQTCIIVARSCFSFFVPL